MNNLSIVDTVLFQDGGRNITVHLNAEQSNQLLNFALVFLMTQGSVRLNELADQQGVFSLEDVEPQGNA